MNKLDTSVKEIIEKVKAEVDGTTDVDELREHAHKMLELLLIVDKMVDAFAEKHNKLQEQRDNYQRLAKNLLNATKDLKGAVDSEDWSKLTENSSRLGEFLQRVSEIINKESNN